ncbi:MAG: AMP-binding protein [Clostridiales bacterium]|jgi:phenylacetate-coenzyme A ligase PaaK-like adenylate-forming protein|nr:AMP-binding protein [Clostridiales bacterium]
MTSPVQAWVAERTGLKERLTAETLKTWQMERVKETIQYAWRSCRYYAERLQGVDTKRLERMADMQHLPFTRPEDVALRPEGFLCVPQREVSRVVTLFTSGSLGRPKRIFFTERDLEKTVDFFACGMSTMTQSGEKTLVLMSGATHYSIGDLLQKALARIGAEAHIHGNVKDVHSAIDAARGFDCLVGVPAELMYMARTEGDLRPKSVLLSADYVPESIIKGIEDRWKCRVYTHYGMTETGFGGGVQCSAGLGYHLRDADLLFEIVDPQSGRQAAPGQYGEVVITTLSREAMPLIRYRTGDMARMLEGACRCGGILPRLDKVMGRYANTIPIEGAKPLSIHKLDELMFAVPEIRNYSAKLIISSRANVLSLTVDTVQDLDADRLSEYIKAYFGSGMDIRISRSTVSPFTGAAKRQISIEHQ